jgi:hypothetical protein
MGCRGVIDYATDYSGAVPRAAVSDPFTMTGWKNQDVKGWRWQLINGYNSTVSATTLYLYIYLCMDALVLVSSAAVLYSVRLSSRISFVRL